MDWFEKLIMFEFDFSHFKITIELKKKNFENKWMKWILGYKRNRKENEELEFWWQFFCLCIIFYTQDGWNFTAKVGISLLSHQCGCDSPSSLSSLESVNVFDAYDFLIAGFTMPHRTRPMTALLLFTSLNAVLCATITPVYDFVCFLPYWERRVTLSFPNFSSSFNSSIQ